MGAARVCVLGVSGLGAEIAKNLVLAGVNTLEMVDSALVSDQDATSQFLAPRDCLGQNRAEASLQRLQQLNPMVKVSATSTETKDKDAEFFKKFDIVVATN